MKPEDGDIDTNHGVRPGRIKHIFVYKFVSGDGVNRSILLARVEWYKTHAKKNMFGVGLDLYSRSEFELFGTSTYIPVLCIKSKFAPVYGSINVAVTGSDNVFEVFFLFVLCAQDCSCKHC